MARHDYNQKINEYERSYNSPYRHIFNNDKIAAKHALVEFNESFKGMNRQDPRFRLAQEFLQSAVDLIEESAPKQYILRTWWVKVRNYGHNTYPAMVDAIKAANKFLIHPKNAAKELLTALDKLQDEVKGPFFYRKENSALRKFVGVLAVMAGLALVITSILFLPVLTFASALVAALFGGGLIGFGLNSLAIKSKEITNQEQTVIDNFAKSTAALIKDRGSLSLFSAAPIPAVPSNGPFQPFSGVGHKLGGS